MKLRKLPVISPTQVSAWRSCKRKFAFTYLTNEPRPPQTAAQALGSALHGKIESFFKTGQPDYSGNGPENKLLPHVIGLLPAGALSEQKVELMIDGLTFGGYFDWLAPEINELGDLKTTSDLKWAKTPDELSKDPQAIIYSLGQRLIPFDRVECRWVYVQTKGFPRVREVRFRPDSSVFLDLVQDGKEIREAWETRPDPNSLEPNTSACDAYGGCPFRAKCKLDPAERLAKLTARMGLLYPGAGATNMGTQKTFEEMMAEASGIEPAAVNPPVQAVTRTEQKEPETVAQLGAQEIPPVLDPAKVEAPKAKRGRKPKDTDPAPAPVSDQPIETLYVSCMPLCAQGELDFADYIVAGARAEINEKAGVEDYRLVQYGAGAGMLVAVVEEKVKAIRPRQLVLDERTPEGRLLVGPLMALATKTVRGF